MDTECELACVTEGAWMSGQGMSSFVSDWEWGRKECVSGCVGMGEYGVCVCAVG